MTSTQHAPLPQALKLRDHKATEMKPAAYAGATFSPKDKVVKAPVDPRLLVTNPHVQYLEMSGRLLSSNRNITKGIQLEGAYCRYMDLARCIFTPPYLSFQSGVRIVSSRLNRLRRFFRHNFFSFFFF
eukprot:COSAG05_NODE_1067_length_5971_cov_450.254257_12_plen_128_part_00